MSHQRSQFELAESDGKIFGVFQPKWPNLSRPDVVEKIAQITFRVYAGNSAGTAFIVSAKNTEEYYSAIFATAWHVIDEAASNPIDVQLVSVDRTQCFDARTDEMRVEQIGPTANDTGLILLKSKRPILKLASLVPILGFHSALVRGAEVGWLGFPGLVEPELCFFNGHVSGFLNDPPKYLIDGVVINGVSGGPVFDDRCHLIGLVSAYLPNRVNEQTTLPGMAALIPINAIHYFMENNMKARVL